MGEILDRGVADEAILDLQSMFRLNEAKWRPHIPGGRMKGQRGAPVSHAAYENMNVIFVPSNSVSIKMTKLCQDQSSSAASEEDRRFFTGIAQALSNRSWDGGLDVVLTQGEIDKINSAWIDKLNSGEASREDIIAFREFNQGVIDAYGTSLVFGEYEEKNMKK